MKKVKRAYAINLNLMLEHADQVFKAPVSAWFRYFVTHNLKVTGEERKNTVEAFPPDKAFLEAEQRRFAIQKELGFNTQADFQNASPEAREELERKILDLREECKEAYENEAIIDKNRNEFCDEEIELDLRTIELERVPEFAGTNEQQNWYYWNLLKPLIKDPPQEAEPAAPAKEENKG